MRRKYLHGSVFLCEAETYEGSRLGDPKGGLVVRVESRPFADGAFLLEGGSDRIPAHGNCSDGKGAVE